MGESEHEGVQGEARAASLSVRELKGRLETLGVGYGDCTEKHELETRLREAEKAAPAPQEGTAHSAQGEPSGACHEGRGFSEEEAKAAANHLADEVQKAVPELGAFIEKLKHSPEAANAMRTAAKLFGQLGK